MSNKLTNFVRLLENEELLLRFLRGRYSRDTTKEFKMRVYGDRKGVKEE